ncbi:MAG: hypothetical protein ACP5IB_08940, partial [Thermoplasmata archaeon]
MYMAKYFSFSGLDYQASISFFTTSVILLIVPFEYLPWNISSRIIEILLLKMTWNIKPELNPLYQGIFYSSIG